jgi:serine/threonine-protein kinase
VAEASAGDSLLGVVIDGRYRIEQRIGEGGMGVVYRAAHVVLKKPLAIKILRGEQAHDPDVVQRFVQEARAASAIGHPNIVNISDFGRTTDGAVYLAMELLAGQTLAEAMQKGPLAQERALGIFVQIAGALDAAHEAGIIHRDLKPENIFLKREPDHPDFVKVLDFGIAKVKNAAAKITRTGMVFGTPHYMSPEQAAGQPVDHRSDVYSLGVIMYQVLAGQLPFEAASFMDLVTKHMFEPPAPLRQAGPHAADLPSTLEAIVMRALQKKPEDRQGSMRELQEALQKVQLRPVSDPAPGVTGEQLVRGPSVVSVAPVQARIGAPVGSATLEAAGLADVVGLVDDDEPIAVPKQRRPAWVWVLAAGVVLAIAVLSLSGGPHEAESTAEAPGEADAAVPAEQRALPALPPSAAVAPAPEADLPAGQLPAAVEPEATPSSKRPSAADQVALPRPVKPRTVRATAQSTRPAAQPAAERAAQPERPRARADDEPLDPWK